MTFIRINIRKIKANKSENENAISALITLSTGISRSVVLVNIDSSHRSTDVSYTIG